MLSAICTRHLCTQGKVAMEMVIEMGTEMPIEMVIEMATEMATAVSNGGTTEMEA